MNARVRRRALVAAIGLLGCAAVQVLPAQEGAVPESTRLLFDSRGGFKLFRLDPRGGTWKPLLNPAVDAPVTLEIWRGGALLPLAVREGGAAAAREGDPGFRGPVFTAADILVQAWGLDLSSTGTDWTAVRYEFENTGSSITTVGIRFIIDTWLGEGARDHFGLADAGGEPAGVAAERLVPVDDRVRFVTSVKPEGGDSLCVLVPARTWPNRTPERVVLANVRRLQNAGAAFEPEPQRAFNLLPFSINDSAVGLLYDSEVLLPGQRVAVDLVLGVRADGDADRLARVARALEAIPVSRSESSRAAPAGNAPVAKKELLARLDELIARLDAMLASGTWRQGDMEKLIQAIDETRRRIESAP